MCQTWASLVQAYTGLARVRVASAEQAESLLAAAAAAFQLLPTCQRLWRAQLAATAGAAGGQSGDAVCVLALADECHPCWVGEAFGASASGAVVQLEGSAAAFAGAATAARRLQVAACRLLQWAALPGQTGADRVFGGSEPRLLRD